MSGNDEESTLQELVIIRRRSGEDDAPHKGGVWKIAYADFMTAMMAFFLVMWLINATDKKVLTQVATYFNPLRLTDRVPVPKGLHDSESGAPESGGAKSHTKSKEGKATGAALNATGDKNGEAALFTDPYGTLERLAKEAAASQRAARAQAVEGPAPQAQGTRARGEAFRDPFAPEQKRGDAAEKLEADLPVPRDSSAKSAAPADVADAKSGEAKQGELKQGEAAQAGAAPVAKDADAGSGKSEHADIAPDAASAAADASKAAANGNAVEKSPEPAQKADQELAQKLAREQAEKAELAKLDGDIKQALRQMAGVGTPDIEVKIVDDGLLISLTDKFDFGMFAIASAEPRPATVLVMDKIAKLLQGRPGRLIVRGHTDGRPFRSAVYDNWRLSTARAHMAYYMLVRGGVDEKRFERIEGYADHDLKVPSDPEAAQNRRIEILLRTPKS